MVPNERTERRDGICRKCRPNGMSALLDAEARADPVAGVGGGSWRREVELFWSVEVTGLFNPLRVQMTCPREAVDAAGCS